jgi:hypothetical protein
MYWLIAQDLDQQRQRVVPDELGCGLRLCKLLVRVLDVADLYQLSAALVVIQNIQYFLSFYGGFTAMKKVSE